MKTTFKTLLFIIPDTVRDRIFNKLDKPSKLVARTVCKRWKTLIDQTLKFRVMLSEETYGFVENFGKRRLIEELKVGFFPQSYPQNGWALAVQALTILPDYRFEVFYESSNGLGGNQPALAMVVMPETKLERLFKDFKNISKLELSSMAIVDVKRHSFLEDMKFLYLKTLNITAEGDHGTDGVRDLLSNRFRRLASLTLKVSNDDDMTLYQELFSFIGNHKGLNTVQCHQLRAPSIQHSDPNNNEGQVIMNLQRDQKLEHVEYADLLQRLGRVALDSLDLYILSTLHMLQAQKVLTTLHLYNLRPENMPIWRTIPSLLEECSKTLKSVVLDGCFCEPLDTDPPGPFSGLWVKPCTNLKTLEVMVCGIKIAELPKFPRSSIRTLFLGHSLSSGQIKYILNNFQKLEQLSLPQAQVPLTQVGNPQISLSNFRNALKLPKLTRLTLSTKTCKYRQIRRFASSLIGVVENGQEMPGREGGSKRGDVEYLIDHKIFIPPVSP